MIKDNLIFLREFVKEFQNTGTCFPTSRKAADELTAPLRGKRAPKRILELGPGTGSVTFPLIETMIDGDTLSICEINPRFMHELKVKLEADPLYQQRKSQIDFYECPIQDFPEQNEKFDVIVCSLPFLNFEREMVEEIFQKLTRLSNQHALLAAGTFSRCRSRQRSNRASNSRDSA